MEIVERYLHAIEFWLPEEQKQDIIAELSEDLYSQIGEKEEQLGRKLSEAELEALLKQRGRPVLVANKYLPQQFLIGPVMFPIYVFVLKIFALCYLPPWCVVFVTVHRIQHPAIGWSSTIEAALSSLWTGAFIGAGVITIVFAVLQRVDAQTHLLDEWQPRQLPPVRHPNEISRATSVFELVANLSIVGWWIGNGWSPDILSVRVSFAPVWMYFFWSFLVIALLNTALSAVNLKRPYWTSMRAWFRLAIDSVGGVMFCWLLKANVIASLAIAGVEPARAVGIRNAIQMWMERAFPYALIVVIVIVAADMHRVFRVNKKSHGLSRAAVA